MPIVLVHGVPEDRHVWDDLARALPERELVTLGLPGFGAPLPDGFAATKEGYLGWLVDALSRLSPGPVDLVGHDWGGILTSRLAATRPDLIRSFVTDVVGFMDPAFAWHDLARIWATPGAGEKFMADQAAASEASRASQFVGLGVSPHYAAALAKTDLLKNQCILSLYRSSVNLYADWGAGAAFAGARGHFVLGTKDPFAPPERSAALAKRLGLGVTLLEGMGHFWPSQGPAVGAAALLEFWRTL